MLRRLDSVVEGDMSFTSARRKNSTAHSRRRSRSSHPKHAQRVIKKIVSGRTRMLRWGVLAPTGDAYAPGVLVGDYTGVRAGATVRVGGGANLLVEGGPARPLPAGTYLGLQARTSRHVAAGMTSFQLRTELRSRQQGWSRDSRSTGQPSLEFHPGSGKNGNAVVDISDRLFIGI